MSLADNLAEQFIEAISRFTPEYIDKINKAKAEGLKLTEPEQKKRDEYNQTIAKASDAMKAIKDAEAEHDFKLAQANESIAKAEDRHSKAKEREDKVLERENAMLKRESNVTTKEKQIANKESNLQQITADQIDENKRLQAWEDDLSEQASSFEQAQKLIKRK